MKIRQSLVSNSSTSSFMSIVPAELHNNILSLDIFQEVLSDSEYEWDKILKKQIIESDIKYHEMNGSKFAMFQYVDADNEVNIPYIVGDKMTRDEYVEFRNKYTEEVCKLEKEKKAIVVADYY